jgi:ectoine hydroxylase-related dioxygenase (phytanoyl-CoA dioxygenase family)
MSGCLQAVHAIEEPAISARSPGAAGRGSLAEWLDRCGYAIVKRVLPPQAIADLRAAIELALARQAQELVAVGLLSAADEARARRFETGPSLLLQCNITPPGGPVMGSAPRSEIAHALDRFRTLPAITALAKEILGPDIVATPQFAVRAHCPERLDFCFPWHQDVFFLKLEKPQTARIVNFWVPLVPITEDTGGVELICASHRVGMLPHGPDQRGGDGPRFTGVLASALPAGEVVAPVLDVGDALIMLDKTVHRSRINHSARVRWSVDIRYAEAGRPLGRTGRAIAIP